MALSASLSFAFIAIVLARLGSPSDGLRCVHTCLQNVIKSDDVDDAIANECKDAKATVACVLDECPENGIGLDDVAKQMRVILFRYCDGRNVPDFRRKLFWKKYSQFVGTLAFLERSCFKEADAAESANDTCDIVSECAFGSSIRVAKNKTPAEVMKLAVGLNQISYAQYIAARFGDSVPSTCHVVFDPELIPDSVTKCVPLMITYLVAMLFLMLYAD